MTFNLTAALDKASYNAGDIMTLTVSGTVTTGSVETDNLTINISSSDGSTTVLTAVASIDKTSPTSWLISGVVDGGGRKWTVGADGHSATAVA